MGPSFKGCVPKRERERERERERLKRVRVVTGS